MNLKQRYKQLKQDIPAIYLVMKSIEIPILAKILVFLTIAYTLSPIDLIRYRQWLRKHFRKPVITNQFISNKLENASDLVSAKMIYNGLLHYDDKKGIMIINKDSFAMTYRAELTAGIDMKKVKIKVSDDKVTVTIPKSKIKNINIDEKSIKFYDQSFALFKVNQKQNLLDAISKAKEDVQKKGDVKSLLKRADQQTSPLEF